MIIKRLTKETLLANIEILTEIDSVIKIDEHWGHENFLIELNGKWDNSYIALEENIIAGFIICSKKNKNTLHIHRLAVREKFQFMGIGTRLIANVINSTDSEINRVTLKVKADNITAQRFYVKVGFKYSYTEDKNYVYERLLS